MSTAPVNVAASLRLCAHQLATMIEHDLTGLTPGQRCDLRTLPCDMLAWADELDPAGAASIPPPSAEIVRLADRRREPDVGLMILGNW